MPKREIAFRHGCSPVNLLFIFRTPIPRNTSGRLLLIVVDSISIDIVTRGIFLIKKADVTA